MTTQAKTRGQAYHEEVEALKAKGMSNAEAVKKIAEQHGKSVGAIRGALYQHRTREAGGTPQRSRRGAMSVEDHVVRARESLVAARWLIDHEVTEAASARDAAQARYEELAASADRRKAEIDKQIAALS